MQLEGMFDLSVAKVSESRWSVNLELPEDWNIGVIVVLATACDLRSRRCGEGLACAPTSRRLIQRLSMAVRTPAFGEFAEGRV